MKTLIVVVEEADKEMVLAELYDLGTLGVVEEDQSLRAFFAPDIDGKSLLEAFRRYQPMLEDAAEVDWVGRVKDMWEPIEVGRRWYLVPEWREDEPPAGRLRLTTHPGMAPGTGLHPSTQLALRMLEVVVKPDDRVLDVGTGSGILAEASRLLGAAVLACDIDVDVAAIARRNLPADAGVFAGSIRSVRKQSFDVVVANLNLAALRALNRDLEACRRPGGKIIVSGIRKEEIALVEETLGSKVHSTLMLEGWVSLVF